MKIKEIWIENYQKYHDKTIVFHSERKTNLQNKLFGNMNIILFSGENGSGKTTILSFISYIFRYLQRFRERLGSDYVLVYEIEHAGGKTIIVGPEGFQANLKLHAF